MRFYKFQPEVVLADRSMNVEYFLRKTVNIKIPINNCSIKV